MLSIEALYDQEEDDDKALEKIMIIMTCVNQINGIPTQTQGI